MDTLKKIFPLSFKYTADVANLIIGILIYAVGGVILNLLIGLPTMLPFAEGIPGLGLITGMLTSLVGIYCTAGIVIQVLVFTKVLK